MGRVRTKTVKRSARHIIEKYYSRLTLDFDINKRVSQVTLLPFATAFYAFFRGPVLRGVR